MSNTKCPKEEDPYLDHETLMAQTLRYPCNGQAVHCTVWQGGWEVGWPPNSHGRWHPG